MKKKLLFLATAAVALASCSSDSTISENPSATLGSQQTEIAFAPISQPSSRAAIQGATFPVTNNMEVVAYQTDPTAEKGNYFPKTTFTRYSTTNIWKGTTSRFWPLSPAKINFFAVSGAGITPTNITIDPALNKTSVATVNYSSATSTTQSDIMYAFGRGYVNQVGNTLYFNSATTSDAPVNMVFKHAMSLIKFQVKAADEVSQAITINSIKLNGAVYGGTLTITSDDAITASTGTPTFSFGWQENDTEDDVIVPNISNYTLTQTYYPADDATWASLIVVPNAAQGFSNFVVNYTLDGKAHTYTYTPSPARSVEAGHVYTYQLNFRLHEITIEPTVTTWEDNGEDEITIQ